jgi:hypothetical protein
MLKILVVDGFRTGITFPIRLRLYLSTALLTPERLPFYQSLRAGSGTVA